jgi:Na+-translocating ferredoxin:NAD+ oxidoreductase RnfG subunit
MKEFLNKKGLIIALSAILIIIFVFGGMYSRYMTNQIDVHEQERYETSIIEMVDQGQSLESFESEGVDKMYVSPSSGDDYQPSLIEAFKVFVDDDELIAYVYVIETNGNAEGVRVAYAMSIEDDSLIDIQVIAHNETVSEENRYYNKLKDSFFDQFEDKDMDVIDYSIDTVSGATYSSLAFEVGMHYARELYASDTDFEIISVILTIDSVSYNTDLQTINDYPFTANITFDEDNKQAVVALDNDFNYVSTVSGDTVSQAVIDALPVFVPEQATIDTAVKIQNYNDATRTLTITVRGFAGNITLGVLINASLDGVEQMSLISTNESYPSPTPPKVEDDYISEYNTNETVLDSVSGATVTSNAMTKAVEWIQTFDAALNGGS